jgi:hypothetical protein
MRNLLRQGLYIHVSVHYLNSIKSDGRKKNGTTQGQQRLRNIYCVHTRYIIYML